MGTNSFATSSIAFCGVGSIRNDDRYPVALASKLYTGEDFAPANFGVRQHDLCRIERFQVAKRRARAFAHAQNGCPFNDIDFFGNPGGWIFRQALSIVTVVSDLQRGNDVFNSFLSCRVGAVNETKDFPARCGRRVNGQNC